MSHRLLAVFSGLCLLAAPVFSSDAPLGRSLASIPTGDDVSPADRQVIQHNIEAFEAKHAPRSRRGADVIEPYPFVPIAGNLWDDLFVNNFVDLDPTAGVKDWDCTDFTYDGHNGHDIDLRGFPYMDLGVPVFAALDGIVSDIHDGEFDRQIGNLGNIPGDMPANYVTIHHGGSQYSIYYHLRKGSIAVGVGDPVKAGQQIGLTGSSGYSGAPHLHFESQDAGAVYEPSAGPCRPGTSHWVHQTPIDRRFYLGEFNVTDAALNNYYDALWGWPRNGTFTLGTHRVCMWFSPHDMPVNSTFQVRFTRPDGSVFFSSPTYPFNNPSVYRDFAYYWVYWDLALDTIGTWHVEFTVNGASLVIAPIEVVQDVKHIVNRPPNSITAVFDPPAPLSSDVVFCRVTSSLLLTDPDYDIVRYHYVWSVNGTVFRDVTHVGRADAIPHGQALAGQSLQCVVTPYDGALYGAPVMLTVQIPSSVAGDVNNDGVVDAADAIRAVQILSGLSVGHSGEIPRGHITVSGPLGLTDAVLIMRKAAGL